jgi:hypothetical protein
VRGLRRAADEDRVDVVPVKEFAIIGGRRLSPGFFANPRKPGGINLGQVKTFHQWMAGADLRSNFPDPPRADDSDLDRLTWHFDASSKREQQSVKGNHGGTLCQVA